MSIEYAVEMYTQTDDILRAGYVTCLYRGYNCLYAFWVYWWNRKQADSITLRGRKENLCRAYAGPEIAPSASPT